MSNAHRPTWAPAMGRESKGNSKQFSNKDLATHTKLKFRQPGQTSTNDVAQSDLRRQLLIAERAAVDKKRRDRGLGALPALVFPGDHVALRLENGEEEGEGEESRKRRKVLEEVIGLDRDDAEDPVKTGEDDDDEDEEMDGEDKKGKGKAKDDGSDSDSSSSDSDSDDDEDDTAELLRELAKIKRERAEEKERQDLLASQSATLDREASIATGNPLLNLAAALGTGPGPSSPTGSTTSTVNGGFKVGRRWDDDLIFKNQASGTEDKNKKKEFVNDLLRSDFHRQFMAKFL
ncbi:Pre-mRNA-splicing factor Cwf15/Cwc15, partial [Mrakia frigida]|uniref:spliceosome-associated CWC15 family protein n=1 Tax=Mrakia frigida TaxID=29902 RepID=UPI003FCBF099